MAFLIVAYNEHSGLIWTPPGVTMNAPLYAETIKVSFFRNGEPMTPVYIQDNAPCHQWLSKPYAKPKPKRNGDDEPPKPAQVKCNAVKKMLEDRNVAIPHWPPRSPDLNLIENMWAWLDGKKCQAEYQERDEMKKAVENAMRDKSFQEAVNKSCLSFYERCVQVVQLKGGQISY
eukprot:GILI01006593.1.p1 GENE.GILI01006593.1~~GILI01006593.1.p1  ORF type:complete len:174 (-),score=8.73 GILI01006593.1:209-730(-)